MQENKDFKDWLFRYQYIYRVRKSKKNKSRFISSLVADISKIRDDIQVIEYGQHEKELSRNIYVGDIEQAERIICAHYDTPIKTIGSYIYFDKKKEQNKTTGTILVSSIIMILLGLTMTFMYTKYATSPFIFFSFSTLFIGIFYGIYFYFLSKIAKGIPERNNLIRNTSSVLSLMEMLKEIRDNKTAFAFIDNGSYGNAGVGVLKTTNQKSAEIFILDSIGSDAPLYLVGNDFSKSKADKLNIEYQNSDEFDFNYLFSARRSEENNRIQYYLDRTDLKQKELNMKNLTKVIDIFKKDMI